VVVTPGMGHVTCCKHRFLQLDGIPHTLGCWPPHVSGRLHAPHWINPPQPSPTGPHRPVQVLGTQGGAPQTLLMPPPPQDCGAVQSPHCKLAPQPSPTGPQLTACPAQVLGVHELPVPHTPDTPPPPHVSPLLQLPQSSCPPQPSPAGPQFNPRSVQLLSLHVALPQTPDTPPPPHVSGDVQSPH
jgi:hypothetical protein